MPAPPDLQALLAEERRCLAQGRIADLAALVPQKAAAVAALAAGLLPLEALRPLLEQARANERLLTAALGGVRAAVSRVRAIQAAENGLTSYTSQGRCVSHAGPHTTVERRA